MLKFINSWLSKINTKTTEYLITASHKYKFQPRRALQQFLDYLKALWFAWICCLYDKELIKGIEGIAARRLVSVVAVR
jgi:hypothetical protein